MGVPVSFLGIELPALTAAVQGRPGLIADLHENAGTFILILAGLHALMAIWHQFVLRDGTLQRMSLR
jgi:cytochrome b561